MKEYLIRPVEGEWYEFPAGSFPYAPVDVPYEKIEGYGDARIRVDDLEISFSFEDPGIQVVFEGDVPDDRAEFLIEAIAANIGKTSGQGATVLEL